MKRMFCKRFLLSVLIFRVSAAVYGQEALLSMSGAGAYSFVERSDWSRYDNDKYTGHVFREVRASILPSAEDKGGLAYHGNFIVLEQTRRDMKLSAKAVNDVVPVRFQMKSNGNFELEDDKGYPSLRGFPTFPTQKIKPGSTWTALAQRVLDPLNAGHPVLMRMPVEYEYKGIEDYKGTQVYRIYAKYSSGTVASPNPFPVADFVKAQGTHTVDILIRVSNGLPLLMRDTFEETFLLQDGSSIRFRGFILTFTEGLLPMDKASVITSITTPADPKTESPRKPVLGGGVSVEESPEGVKLTVQNIRFAPDSAVFLPEENGRLDRIADALKQIPDRTFLVEGHTASTGRPSSEMELSVQRAQRMIDELVKRGIPEDRFLYKGWGGAKPVSDNATDAGRAQNRRVEITILE
jgi:outer membrane protein OmpA-like peptidoglycan-associated protein